MFTMFVHCADLLYNIYLYMCRYTALYILYADCGKFRVQLLHLKSVNYLLFRK